MAGLESTAEESELLKSVCVSVSHLWDNKCQGLIRAGLIWAGPNCGCRVLFSSTPLLLTSHTTCFVCKQKSYVERNIIL